MIAVPFIYFSLIALWQYIRNKNRIDIGFLIAALYAVSGLFSIFYKFYTYDVNYEINFIPCFVYCSLLTLNLLPFLKYSHLGVNIVPSKSSVKWVKILSWMAIGWFGLTLLFSFNQFIIMLTGDMLAARAAVYQGVTEDGWMSQLPFIIRMPIVILNLCFGCPWILILLAFYSYFILNLPLKYFLFFFIASLSGPFGGILGADRSHTAYWILSLFGIYSLFLPSIPQKLRKYMNTFIMIIVVALCIYLSMMTIARFEDRDMGIGNVSGVEASLISYLGQSYPKFCYFFDYFTPAFSNLNLLFPFTAKYILGEELVGGVMLQQEMDLRTGISTGVFYTYLGHILIFCGKSVMFIFSFLYSFISVKLLKSFKKRNMDLKGTFIYFGLSSIMILGLFTYHYATPKRTFSIFFFLFLFNRITKVVSVQKRRIAKK